jgi:hypothetical protein
LSLEKEQKQRLTVGRNLYSVLYEWEINIPFFEARNSSPSKAKVCFQKFGEAAMVAFVCGGEQQQIWNW